MIDLTLAMSQQRPRGFDVSVEQRRGELLVVVQVSA
jgi:hypothetical protein